MSNEVTRTPAEVAADINTIKSHASAVFRAAVDEGKRSCIRIGKLLEEAKSLLPHGEWGAWLKTNVDYSESTAQNLMRCYREFGGEQIDLFSGVSDADFFAVLSQSQMIELLALPKEQRRSFVEKHREKIEDGSMSTRDMKVEIAKLKMENEAKTEALEKTKRNLEIREKDCNELSAMLDEERRKPAPEPVVQEIITNQPSAEQIEAIRAEEAARLEEEHRAGVESIKNIYRAKIEELERERNEALDKAAEKGKSVNDLVAEKEKIKADHKAAMDKLNADHAKKLAELEEAYKKQAKASANGADHSLVRVQIALEGFRREVRAVTAVLAKLTEEGQGQKADKLRAQVERVVSDLIAEAGWTV